MAKVAMDATDGVIKFTSERHVGPIPWGPQLEALNHARTTLFDLGLIGAYPDGVGYGNLSLRTSGGQGHQDNRDNQFVITGSATGAQRTLQPIQYCLVEAFSIEHNWVRARGAIDASSESMTHGAVYAANPAIHCVIHVHSRSLFDTLLHQNHPATPATTPYGTPAMARAVCALVQQSVALPLLFVMAGHDEGIIACGMDVDSVLNVLLATTNRICTP